MVSFAGCCKGDFGGERFTAFTYRNSGKGVKKACRSGYKGFDESGTKR